MAFSDHKIQTFTHRLADLPDQPNLSAAELKAYFDSSPEELRQAVNGICTDAERLDDRVSGIVAETFGDSIPKTMLAQELQSEIDAKAEETTVAARLEAEQAARETLAQTVAQKCEVYFGTYKGDGAYSQAISLGFQPVAVLVSMTQGYNSYHLEECGAQLSMANDSSNMAVITEDGFTVYGSGYGSNVSGQKYAFAAFR